MRVGTSYGLDGSPTWSAGKVTTPFEAGDRKRAAKVVAGRCFPTLQTIDLTCQLAGRVFKSLIIRKLMINGGICGFF